MTIFYSKYMNNKFQIRYNIEKGVFFMLMIPRRNNFDVFDEMFRDPFFNTERESRLMKTDIKENKDNFIIDIDLPGYEKENIKMEIEDGYLVVHAKVDKNMDKKEDGKYVRKERYTGECTRSFYIGDDIKEEDIKASFKNGTLSIELPKKEAKEELPNKRYIEIGD